MSCIHVNIVITKNVINNISKLIDKLKVTWPNYNTANIEFSITITNRNNTTIDTIKELADGLGYKCGKSIFELSYFNEEWDNKTLVQEVFKILPKSVVAEDIWIISDLNFNSDNNVVASHSTIHNIYHHQKAQPT